jgi:predicted dehydrogenase
MDIDVAVIGCGRMGRERARAALSLGARVVAVHDPDIERARALAAEANESVVVPDWREIDFDALDAVFVCTPPSSRGPVEALALAAGVPLFVEKPIGLSAAHAAATLEMLDSAPGITAVGYMNRYRASVQAARDAVRSDTVLGLSASWAGGRYAVPWWSEPAHSGGPINEQATHLVDLMRFLVGEISAVQAIADEADEAATVNVRFRNGTLGSLLYTCRARHKAISLQVVTQDSRVCLEGWDLRLRGEDGSFFPEMIADRHQIFEVEVAAFFDAVRKDSPEPILCDFREAIGTQRAIDAIRRSSMTQRTEPVG